MDLGAFLILSIIFGLITVMFSILYILWPAMMSPSDINTMTLSINRLTSWLINFLPGALIGDIAGVFIAKIIGEEL